MSALPGWLPPPGRGAAAGLTFPYNRVHTCTAAQGRPPSGAASRALTGTPGDAWGVKCDSPQGGHVHSSTPRPKVGDTLKRLSYAAPEVDKT